MRSRWKDGERTREVELTPLGAGRFRATVDGAEFEVAAEPLGAGRWRIATADGVVMAEVTAAGERRFVRLGALDFVLERAAEAGRRRERGTAGGGLEAPMPCVVTRVLVAAGEEVTKGQPLVALEAMKMEHLIRAPRAGRIVRVNVQPGEMVNGGVPVVELEA